MSFGMMRGCHHNLIFWAARIAINNMTINSPLIIACHFQKNPAYFTNIKGKETFVNSGDQCFICDQHISARGVPLLMTYTPYSNVGLPTKIGQLMGDGFMVIVASTDMLCRRCCSLISQLDKLEFDINKVKTALTGYLKAKYQLNEVDRSTQEILQCDNYFDGMLHNVQDNCGEMDEPFYSPKGIDYCLSKENIKNIKAENLDGRDEVHSEDEVLNEIYEQVASDEYSLSKSKTRYFHCNREGKEEKFKINTSDGFYKCNSCTHKSLDLDTFMEHLKIHSKKVLYKCTECSQKFETPESVESHIVTVHGIPDVQYSENICDVEEDPNYCPSGQKLFECHVCKYQHHEKKVVDVHIHKHLKKEQLFTCNICFRVFKHKITLKKHMCGHRYYKCDFCPAVFQNQASLLHHFKVKKHNAIASEGHDNPCPQIEQISPEQGSENQMLQNIPLQIKSSEKSDIKDVTVCVSDPVAKIHYDQVEVLLEKIHTDVPNPEECNKFNHITPDNIKAEDPVEVKKIDVDVSTDITGVSLKTCSDEVSPDFQNSKALESNNEKSEHDNNEDTCDILKILSGSGPTILEEKVPYNDFKKDEAVDHHTTTEETEVVELPDDQRTSVHSEPVESASKRVYVCSLCGLQTSSESHIKRHFKCHIALENEMYKCDICGRVLTTHSNLKRHISLHENCSSGEVQCSMCYETVTDRLHLKHHMEMKHPESYQCSFCDEQFGTKKQCREHELTHPSLKCDVCEKMFLTEGRLRRHQELMHHDGNDLSFPTKSFKCHICCKILTTYHNLKRHLRNHERCSGAVHCTLCHEELTDRLHLRQHIEEQHPETHQCSFCHKVFSNQKTCKTHEMTHPERFVFRCDACDKVFLTEPRLKRHCDIVHRDPHCRVCGKEITNPVKLLDHERRHERHKAMFPCEQCPKVFRTPSGLKYHMSVHTGKYAVYCEICGKGLHSEVVLEEHKATHTKEVRYTCEKCGRTFSSNSTYRMHRLWHDNPLPYKCNMCDRKFKHTSILAVHKRRAHTGERPYKCLYCTMTFSVSSTLNKHMILHTKQYPYRCEQCSKGFTTRTKIAKHMAKMHGDYEMLNSKKRTCEYKMVLHPNELAAAPGEVLLPDEPDCGAKEEQDSDAVDPNSVATLQVLAGAPGSPVATLQVLGEVAVDPSQTAIFTLFQPDLQGHEFNLQEFDAIPK